MKFLFIRLLPWITACVAIGIGYWSMVHPRSFPWSWVVLVGWYVCAVGVIGWTRVSWQELAEKFWPTCVFLLSCAFASLLADHVVEQTCVIALACIVPSLTLELLFSLAFERARYPVNALSHVNLALVPCTMALLAFAWNGLSVFYLSVTRGFLYSDPYLAPLVFGGVLAVLYFVTSHPNASSSDRRRWAVVGGLLGAHIGWLAVVMPYHALMHASVSALLAAFPLRVRRYQYAPTPSRRVAWIESFTALVLFIGLMLTGKWA